jgi:hypothetical protein
MRIKYLPRVFIATVIGTVLFMSIMPDSIKGMPAWVFYSTLAFSFLIGWLAATGIEKAFLWFLEE